MDIAAKAIFLPQDAQRFDHALTGVIRIFDHTGAQKQPLNIVAFIKMDRQLRKFFGREGCTRHIIGATVNAILAVINAGIAHKHFQKRDAPTIRRETVAKPAGGRVADTEAAPLGGGAIYPAARAGGVIFRGVGKDTQFIKKIHRHYIPESVLEHLFTASIRANVLDVNRK